MMASGYEQIEHHTCTYPVIVCSDPNEATLQMEMADPVIKAA